MKNQRYEKTDCSKELPENDTYVAVTNTMFPVITTVYHKDGNFYWANDRCNSYNLGKKIYNVEAWLKPIDPPEQKPVDYEGILGKYCVSMRPEYYSPGHTLKQRVIEAMQEAVKQSQSILSAGYTEQLDEQKKDYEAIIFNLKQSRGIVWVTNEEIEAEVERRGIVSCWDKMHGRTMARWAIEKMRELNK